jgi:hypothetical protein
MVRAVNDALVRVAPGFLRLAKVTQNQKGTVTAVACPTASAAQLCLFRDTILDAARRLDPSVIGVDPTEEWTRLKVHGVDARRYLGRMDALKRELMTDNDGLDIPMQIRWLTDESTVRRRLEDGAIRASSITFAVKDRASAIRATKRGLFLSGQTLTADLFLKAGPGAFCSHCSGWGHLEHGCPAKKAKEPPQCAYCEERHLTSTHTCNVLGCEECRRQPGRVCKHTKSALRCPNCGGNHAATDNACSHKRQATKDARSTRGRPRQARPSGANATPIGRRSAASPTAERTGGQRKPGIITLAETRRPNLVSQPPDVADTTTTATDTSEGTTSPTPSAASEPDSDEDMADAVALVSHNTSVPATPEAQL